MQVFDPTKFMLLILQTKSSLHPLSMWPDVGILQLSCSSSALKLPLCVQKSYQLSLLLLIV